MGFCGSTEMCQHGNASLLGGWMAHYLDHHFEYNPGLELLVTNMIQQDAIMEARCIYGNQLLAAVPLADKSNMDLTAKLCGMVMRFGQLGVFARVSLRSKGIVFCWSADGWDTEFDMLLQPSIQAFNATFSAFMTKIPSWGTANSGLFGLVCGFWGEFEIMNAMALLYMCCCGLTNLIQGFVGDMIWSVFSWGASTMMVVTECQMLMKFSPSSYMNDLLLTALTDKSHFTAIASTTNLNHLTATECSQVSYCHASFLMPHLTSPVFCVLLGDSIMSSPKEWTNWQWMIGTVHKLIIEGIPTEYEVWRLWWGLDDIICSHSFVDVDLEGLVNMVIRVMNEWVLLQCLFLFWFWCLFQDNFQGGLQACWCIWDVLLPRVMSVPSISLQQRDKKETMTLALLWFQNSTDEWQMHLCVPLTKCFCAWKLVVVKPWHTFSDLHGNNSMHREAIQYMQQNIVHKDKATGDNEVC